MLFATYWPEFESRDSGMFNKKNKLVQKLPTNINDLSELPEQYKLTTTKQRLLASLIELFSKLMIMISVLGLTIHSESKKW